MKKLKTIIAGSRDIREYDLALKAIKESEFAISEVVSGRAPGVDSLGERYANENGIPIKPFPAEWDNLSHPDAVIKTNSYGKKYDALAGFRRNKQMAEYADALIAVTTGSPGTADMIKLAEERKLKIFILYVGNFNSYSERK